MAKSKQSSVMAIACVVLVAVIAVIALIVSLVSSGVFEPKEIKTDFEIVVQFSEEETNYDNTTGLKLFYDDNGTEYDTSDDLYYRIERYKNTEEDAGTNQQKDGFVIMNSTGTFYALCEMDLSEKVTLRVKSTYDVEEAERETKIFVNGKVAELRADALLKETGVKLEDNVIIDASSYVPAGTGLNIQGFNGIVYMD